MDVVDSVKRIIVFFVVISLFTYTPLAHARTLSASEKTALFDRIEILVQQVEKLQRQLALLQAKGAKAQKAVFTYKTKFYTGNYEALYQVDGERLIAGDGSSVRASDQLLWNTFVSIAGESFAEDNISEFRIYNDTKSEISAFVEEKPDDTWVIGFNREGKDISKIYSQTSVIELFLHEYAHIVFFTDPSIEKDFKKIFWSNGQRTTDFITAYASSNATEDLAETFVYFVTHNRPTQEGIKFDKVRFLYKYKELTKLRDQLRESPYF